MKQRIIDPHLHLFNLETGIYEWLRPDQAPFWPDKHMIARSYSERDLVIHCDGLSDLTLSGYVHIEAGFDNTQSVREVDWVQSQACMAQRSVGFIDLRLAPSQFETSLSGLLDRPSVVGVRHILDDDIDLILDHPNTLENFKKLALSDVIFELQFDVSNTANVQRVLELLDALPQLTFVLNHHGFGDVDTPSWILNLNALAQRQNIFVKCSGFEMRDRIFSIESAVAIINACLESFGESRVMVASNFPLVTLSMGYSNYWTALIAALRAAELPVDALVYANAKRIYQFK